MASRVFSRSVRGSFGYRLVAASSRKELCVNGFHSLEKPAAGSAILPFNKSAPLHSKLLLSRSIVTNATLQRFGFSSAASPQPTDETNQYDTSEFGNSSDTEISPDPEAELSMDELVKLIVEKEKLIQLKDKELKEMQDKVLCSYAEIENIIERTKREAENSRKFSIQSFVKSLLDVADNLARASSVVKESFTKLDTSKGSTGVVPVLETLLEGVELTDKQLSKVFRKFGVAKFDPINEQFDPHRHFAIFQVPDPSKPPGTVAAVLKSGYMLHDRVIRPAEVGVTKELNE